MAFKIIALFALVAVVSAGVIHESPLYAGGHYETVARVEPFNPNPQYTFGYEIKNGLTGDEQSRKETRNGDLVHGQYSLIDADGTRRVVDYTADALNGFNAVVRKEPLAVKVVQTPIVKTFSPIVENIQVPHREVILGHQEGLLRTPFLRNYNLY